MELRKHRKPTASGAKSQPPVEVGRYVMCLFTLIGDTLRNDFEKSVCGLGMKTQSTMVMFCT
jgi:hypothetical protein